MAVCNNMFVLPGAGNWFVLPIAGSAVPVVPTTLLRDVVDEASTIKICMSTHIDLIDLSLKESRSC